MKKFLLIIFFQLILLSHQLISQSQPAFYGFQTHFGQFYRTDMDSADVEAMLDLVQAAGFKMIRDESYWSEVEKIRGIYNFPDQIDHYIQAAKRRGIDVLLILDYNNPLYAPHAGSAVTTDSNRIAFARYCQEAVKRYSTLGITYYEIWNEPNIPIFWDPTPNALDYVKLIQVVYPAIKAIDSTVTVICCATSPAEGNPPPFIDWLSFISLVFQNGGGDFMDAVSYHSYHVDQRPEVNFFSDIQKLQAIVGADRPLWLSEIGYPTNTGWPNISLEQQANYTARLFLSGKMVEQLHLISYYDLKNDGEQASNPEHNFGVLFFNLQPKPVFYALKTVAILIADKLLANQNIQGDVYVLEFGDQQDWVTATWKNSGQTFQKINIQSPFCRLVNRDGSVENDFITADSSVTITVDESPCYLCRLATGPRLAAFDLQPNRVILYPQQKFEIQASGTDTSGIPIQFQLSALHWEYSGTGGKVDHFGKFQAFDAGNGLLIGSYQDFSDTILVEIIKPGTHVIDDFNSIVHWQLSTLNLNSLLTTISISDSIFNSEPSSARIDYQFTYQTSIPSTQYRIYLQTELLLPGEPDSLLIDFYGNGQPHKIRFQFSDAFGEQFIRTLSAALSWKDEWRTIRIPLKNLSGMVDYPLSINLITIYIGVENARNDSSYFGTIYLDNLLAKSNLGTGIAEPQVDKSFQFKLYQNFPNPFNPSTEIRFTLNKSQFVTLQVFNLLGQEVAVLINDFKTAGDHCVQFNSKGLSNGLYLYQLEVGGRLMVKKMVILR